jgi:hypothetical protein
VNVDEIIKSEFIKSAPLAASSAIKTLMRMPAIMLYDNPIKYITSIGLNKEMSGSILQQPLYRISAEIANGNILISPLVEEYAKQRNDLFAKLCDILNTEAAIAKTKIQSKSVYASSRTVMSNRFVVELIIKSVDKGELHESFKWNSIELFENVLNKYMLNMETENLTLKPNDIYDIFQLAYVQPGDMFWTYDNKLKKKIISCGMKEYLFNE